MDSHGLRKELAQLIERVESVELRVPEDSALIGLATDLLPKVTRLLRQGLELLETVEDYYSSVEPDTRATVAGFQTDAGELREIAGMVSSAIAARELIDMIFFARADLRAAHEELIRAATRKQPLWVASSCESGLRRLRKALVSIESAVYEYEDHEPPERQWLDVELSLEIRKLYSNLRRETRQPPGHQDGSLEDRLRAVLYRTVAFRELKIYPFLRVDDRVQLRQLLSRILEWLNSDARDPGEGRRLWRDLVGFTEILAQVSHRQELQDHDRAMLSKAYRVLFGNGPMPAEVPAYLLAELHGLEGLDEELDHLILSSTPSPVEHWRRPLERLLGALS